MSKAGRPSEVIGRMGKSGCVVVQSNSHFSKVIFGKAHPASATGAFTVKASARIPKQTTGSRH